MPLGRRDTQGGPGWGMAGERGVQEGKWRGLSRAGWAERGIRETDEVGSQPGLAYPGRVSLGQTIMHGQQSHSEQKPREAKIKVKAADL